MPPRDGKSVEGMLEMTFGKRIAERWKLSCAAFYASAKFGVVALTSPRVLAHQGELDMSRDREVTRYVITCGRANTCGPGWVNFKENDSEPEFKVAKFDGTITRSEKIRPNFVGIHDVVPNPVYMPDWKKRPSMNTYSDELINPEDTYSTLEEVRIALQQVVAREIKDSHEKFAVRMSRIAASLTVKTVTEFSE